MVLLTCGACNSQPHGTLVEGGGGAGKGGGLLARPRACVSVKWEDELGTLLPHIPPPACAVLDLEWVKRVDFILSVLSTVQ